MTEKGRVSYKSIHYKVKHYKMITSIIKNDKRQTNTTFRSCIPKGSLLSRLDSGNWKIWILYLLISALTYRYKHYAMQIFRRNVDCCDVYQNHFFVHTWVFMSWISVGVRLSALASRGTMLTFSCRAIINLTSIGLRLRQHNKNVLTAYRHYSYKIADLIGNMWGQCSVKSLKIMDDSTPGV